MRSYFHSESSFTVQDFGQAWRDGILFLHLINALESNLVDISSSEIARMTNRQRLEIAFTVAEQNLGIHRLLDPEVKLQFFFLVRGL